MAINVSRDGVITAIFSEWVEPQSAREGVVLHPAPDSGVEISVKGRRVQIRPRSLLRENTTYHLGISQDLTDYSSNPIAVPQTIIFSTGESIDSLKIAGCVPAVSHRTDSAMAPKIALFFEERVQLHDSILLGDPDYLTQADSVGSFQVNNVSAGEYRVVGFEDKNRDNKITPSERVYLPKNPTTLSTQFEPLTLFAASSDTTQQRIKTVRALSPEIVQATLSYSEKELPFVSLNIARMTEDTNSLTVPAIKTTLLLEDGVTLLLFLSDTLDNVGYVLLSEMRSRFVRAVADSLVYDTLRFNGVTQADTTRPAVPQITMVQQYPQNPGMRISWKTPMIFAEDTVHFLDTKDTTHLFLQKADTAFYADLYPLKDSLLVQDTLSIDHLDVQTVTGVSTVLDSSIHHFFVVPTIDTISTEIRWNISPPLFDAHDDMWELHHQARPLVYTSAEPVIRDLFSGQYRLFCYQDENKNQRHDVGTLFPFVPSEPSIFLSDTLTARARWEVEYDIMSPIFCAPLLPVLEDSVSVQ